MMKLINFLQKRFLFEPLIISPVTAGRIKEVEKSELSYYFNCWSATLYVLGVEDRTRWVLKEEMQAWLDGNTFILRDDEIEPGDIFVMYARPDKDLPLKGLIHTALYLGNGKYWDKKGNRVAGYDTIEGIKKEYSSWQDLMYHVRLKKVEDRAA